MKRLGLIIILIGFAFSATHAQTEQQNTLETEKTDVASPEMVLSEDSLSVPLASPVSFSNQLRPFGMYGITPFDYNFATWELHKGFNASIGLNVTFSPSKWAPSGVGFGQDFAFMYAVPVSDRLSVAAGLYATNMDWGFLRYRNVGFAGVAAYRLTDKISIYAYGNKSFMPNRPGYFYPLPNYTPDRIGGMVNFKLGESSSISIGVEGRKNDYPWWY